MNETEKFNLEEWLGPRQDPHAAAMTGVYAILLVTGLVGNVCTCLVVVRNRHMHTATNYYLFSLAVSDLLLLVLGLPQDAYLLWSRYPYPFGEWFCVLRGWTSEASTDASVLTITAFTAERYLAICHPLRAHAMSRLSRAVKLILVVWAVAAVSAIPVAYQLGIVYEVDPDTEEVLLNSASCSLKRHLSFAFEISASVFFVVPAVLLSILYLLIGLQLRRSTQIPNGDCSGMGRKRSSTASRKDVIKMLVAVVVAFFLCWAPFHAQRLMAVHVSEPTETDHMIFSILTHISGITYYISATINPILYSIMSLKFRHAFLDTLGWCLGRRRKHRDTIRTRTASLFNSTIRSAAYEFTDFTVVSDFGSHRKSSARPPKKVEVTCQNNVKKTSTSISNASLQMVDDDAFDDASISDYIDQSKDDK